MLCNIYVTARCAEINRIPAVAATADEFVKSVLKSYIRDITLMTQQYSAIHQSDLFMNCMKIPVLLCSLLHVCAVMYERIETNMNCIANKIRILVFASLSFGLPFVNCSMTSIAVKNDIVKTERILNPSLSADLRCIKSDTPQRMRMNMIPVVAADVMPRFALSTVRCTTLMILKLSEKNQSMLFIS